MNKFILDAAKVKPSQRQLDWFDMEMYMFCHFGVNTYTDREWGLGDEPESIFNPTELDCEQWARVARETGFKGIIITAKHHDGFCLWPSKYTEHCTKNSPGQPNVVKALSDACKREGIKFGFYLSPWDRNSKLYGTPEYNDYFCNQLTELLTEFGDVFCVWFDNACGEGENGKRQVYDFPRYIELVRKYQPNAVIFNDFGPDTRWVGNEAGDSRAEEWSVVPCELGKYAEVQTGPAPFAGGGNIDKIYNSDADIGSREVIQYSRGLTFVPSEVDTSIFDAQWFWHETSQPRSLDRLFDIYMASVGSNACLNLNIPPNKLGKFDDNTVNRLYEFAALIKERLSTPINATLDICACSMGCSYKVNTNGAKLSYVVLGEDIAQGQRVESFVIKRADNGNVVYDGKCIGHKKICKIPDEDADAGEYIIAVTSSRDRAIISKLELY